MTMADPSPDSHGASQFGEDRRLAEIFRGVAQGVCLEVGAYDGVTGSATLAFERLGWTTILVEPLPELAAAIRRARSGRLFEAAAGPVNGTVTFRRAQGDAAISSVAGSDAAGELYERRNVTWEEVTVKQLTIDTMLAEAGVTRLDFATIDVEGYELEALRGWNLARWKPRVLVVEDNSRGTDLRVAAWLRQAGYVCFDHTVVNDWYARVEDRKLATPTARLRQSLRIAYRRVRPLLLRLAPARLKARLRRRGLAGD
jgi:FkbM family methyltransferase